MKILDLKKLWRNILAIFSQIYRNPKTLDKSICEVYNNLRKY